MKPKVFSKPRRKSFYCWALLVVLAFMACSTQAQPQSIPEAFSFVGFGDTRGEPYLPGGVGQSEAMPKVLQARFQQQGQLKFTEAGRQLESIALAGKAGQPGNTYL